MMLMVERRDGSAETTRGTGVYWRAQYLTARCSEFCYFALKKHFTLAKGFIMISRPSLEETLPFISV